MPSRSATHLDDSRRSRACRGNQEARQVAENSKPARFRGLGGSGRPGEPGKHAQPGQLLARRRSHRPHLRGVSSREIEAEAEQIVVRIPYLRTRKSMQTRSAHVRDWRAFNNDDTCWLSLFYVAPGLTPAQRR